MKPHNANISWKSLDKRAAEVWRMAKIFEQIKHPRTFGATK